MTTLMPAERFRAYRAPQEHRGLLIDPPLHAVAEALAHAKQSRVQTEIEFGREPYHRFAQRAQRELHQLALDYTQSYRSVPDRFRSFTDRTQLVVAGHQPELFHPGVWFKNFALAKLGREPNSVAINLLVDHDICRTPAIRIPFAATPQRWQVIQVPFDAPQIGLPWQERTVIDPSIFEHFPREVTHQLASPLSDPLLHELWPLVREAHERRPELGLCLAEGRHRIEERLGIETLELPMSVAFNSQTFFDFVLGLLGELPRLQTVYNEALHEYRIAHHIRSRAHPVPALEIHEDWLEAPFWIYRPDAPQRRQLFVRCRGGTLELTDRHQWSMKLEHDVDHPAASLELLETLQATRVRLRPRALMTTMYSRMILGDLFLHGIGGGKYDQLTDLIIRRFFQLEPPPYCVISATIHLPNAPDAHEVESHANRLSQQLRRLQYQPETFRESAHLPERLGLEKQRLLQERPHAGSRKAWHDRMIQVNQRMTQQLEPVRRRLMDEWMRAEQESKQARLWASREWAFCLYPLQYMQEEMQRLCDLIP